MKRRLTAAAAPNTRSGGDGDGGDSVDLLGEEADGGDCTQHTEWRRQRQRRQQVLEGVAGGGGAPNTLGGGDDDDSSSHTLELVDGSDVGDGGELPTVWDAIFRTSKNRTCNKSRDLCPSRDSFRVFSLVEPGQLTS